MSKTVVFDTPNYEVVEMHEQSFLARHKEDVPRTYNDPISGNNGEFFDTEEEAINSLPETN